jgi:hypothetical protein
MALELFYKVNGKNRGDVRVPLDAIHVIETQSGPVNISRQNDVALIVLPGSSLVRWKNVERKPKYVDLGTAKVTTEYIVALSQGSNMSVVIALTDCSIGVSWVDFG